MNYVISLRVIEKIIVKNLYRNKQVQVLTKQNLDIFHYNFSF